MKNSEARSSQRVRVTVIIKPLITIELGCTDCISVVHGEPLPQVQVGSQYFTFNYVYGGSTGSPSFALYNDCVSPLVDALFHGCNATVLAYGQMGSGKMYTMGTNYSGEASNVGVIPKVMEDIFQRVEVMKDSNEFVIRVSFVKVLMDEVYDLLVPNLSSIKACKGFHTN
nr:kinesin-like protein kin-4c [Quercus suber]